MTTVLVGSGGIAADTLIDMDGVRHYSSKLFSCDKYVIGVAGDYDWCKLFMTYLRDKRKTKIKKQVRKALLSHECESMQLLVLDKQSHCIQLYDNNVVGEIIDAPYAIGSGGEYARAAYLALIEYKEQYDIPSSDNELVCRAVESACKVDMCSGGEVDCIRFYWL